MKSPKSESVTLSPVELEVIRCLRDDPRSSFSKIASTLGMPESTVRHRVNRLVRDGIIEFATSMNPFQFGYQIWTFMQIQVEIGRVEQIADQLATEPQIYFVGITTGSFDILANGVFRSNAELLTFMTQQLGKVQGVVRISTSTILKAVKRTLPFGISDDVIMPTPGRADRSSHGGKGKQSRARVARSTDIGKR